MGNSISESYDLNQSITNSIIQSQSTNCQSSQATNVSGNTITVINGNLNNTDIGISVKNQQNSASCLMTNDMSSQVENIMKSQFSQTAEAQSVLFDFLKADSIKLSQNTTQNIANVITQITQSTCESDQITNVNNNYIYVADVSGSGNFIGVQVSGQTASASCSMNNYTSANASNDTRAQGNQSGKITNSLGLIIMIIVVIVIIICIGLVFAGFFGVTKVINKKKEAQANAQAAQTAQQPYYPTFGYEEVPEPPFFSEESPPAAVTGEIPVTTNAVGLPGANSL